MAGISSEYLKFTGSVSVGDSTRDLICDLIAARNVGQATGCPIEGPGREGRVMAGVLWGDGLAVTLLKGEYVGN